MKPSVAVMLIVMVLALAAPVSAQSVGEKTGINSALGVSPSTPDFVKQVAISDIFEIESSNLAQQKADAETKKFASKMVADHIKTSNELKAMVKGVDKAPLPTAMDGFHKGKLDKLKGLSGDQFTKQYRADQVTAHTDAVSLFDRYAKGGDNEKLKGWAAKTLPALKHHLEMAEALNK
jgi:putative membrane protein